jgi:hypothetical protein
MVAIIAIAEQGDDEIVPLPRTIKIVIFSTFLIPWVFLHSPRLRKTRLKKAN